MASANFLTLVDSYETPDRIIIPLANGIYDMQIKTNNKLFIAFYIEIK